MANEGRNTMNIQFTYDQYINIATPILKTDPAISYQGYGEFATKICPNDQQRLLEQHSWIEFDLSHFWLTGFTPPNKIDAGKPHLYLKVLETQRLMTEYFQIYIGCGPLLIAARYLNVPYKVLGSQSNATSGLGTMNSEILLGIRRSRCKGQFEQYEYGIYRHSSCDNIVLPDKSKWHK